MTALVEDPASACGIFCVETRDGYYLSDGYAAGFDAWVAELKHTGYLHNHARMWLASYVVHLRKVHWRAGADWLYAHLLDGDLASNHLSWQWVAGTGSHKPYLFNAENVARIAHSAAVLALPQGRGAVIAQVDDHNFRGFWYGGNRVYLNAVFFGRAIKPVRAGDEFDDEDAHSH